MTSFLRVSETLVSSLIQGELAKTVLAKVSISFTSVNSMRHIEHRLTH